MPPERSGGRFRRKGVGVAGRRRAMAAAGETRMIWKRGRGVAMQAVMKAAAGVNGEKEHGGGGGSCGGNGGKEAWCKGEEVKGSVE